eukprot:CAMPEP_0201218172 /NCGR_PEP_ID=MMETSP0851-20130426/190442_1 /ASSEMBLY_ACC=CAM_ASM_000631 /TAXON_ID=183588 /ORGANISM="Pseudo-nitzschia fraudulenta, Strain WWA7" /LENGTH=412 /DNA_ID=CAMNT_0047507851 /DNA_START=463 /DNA_END=1703 /DNA_ORIENTATION=+
MRERNPLLGVKSIGVDYGLVRTGIAVTIGYNPEGLDVIVTDHPERRIIAFLVFTGSNKPSELLFPVEPESLLLSSKDADQAADVTKISNDNTNKTTAAVTCTSEFSKKQERKRYDNELEEAFAQQMRERNPLLGVKSIGVDYGLVRTGITVTIGYNPKGLDMIVTDHPLLQEDEKGNSEAEAEKEEERRLEIQHAEIAQKVVELARREIVDQIVVGLPLHKNGTEAAQTTLARKFACDHLATVALRSLGPEVSVYMCDERYTSKEAAARIRTQSFNGGKSNNNDLYGLLDTESAKIILEQYYDDHLDQYNTRNSDGGDESDQKNANPGYNGELVTIRDPDLVEALTLEYTERQKREREQLVDERNNREARAKWRKLAMEQDRIRAEEQQEKDASNDLVSSKKKKKKKKRKRK